jgi:hypothetical protein
MRDADDDQPGPGDSEAFVESMLDQAFAAVAGLEIHPAAQRLAEIAMRYEQGLIEQFNFTAEEAHNSARQFLTRALDEITRAMREEVLRSTGVKLPATPPKPGRNHEYIDICELRDAVR